MWQINYGEWHLAAELSYFIAGSDTPCQQHQDGTIVVASSQERTIVLCVGSLHSFNAVTARYSSPDSQSKVTHTGSVGLITSTCCSVGLITSSSVGCVCVSV